MSSDQGCPSSRGDGPTEKEGMRVPGCANEGWCGWREKEGKALPARALFSLVAGGAAHPLLLFVPPCPVSAPVAHPRIRASTSTSPSLPSPHGILLIAHRPPRQIPRPIGPFHPPPRPVLLRNTKLPRPEKHCACRQQHLASVAADQESVCVSPQLGAGVCRTLFQIPASGQERGVCVWNLWLHRRPRDTLSRKHRAPLGNHGWRGLVITVAPSPRALPQRCKKDLRARLGFRKDPWGDPGLDNGCTQANDREAVLARRASAVPGPVHKPLCAVRDGQVCHLEHDSCHHPRTSCILEGWSKTTNSTLAGTEGDVSR